jgi:L-aspartate oxidase
MGGVATDLWGQTSLPGLYAVGEVASTGVHGANRLASNSLLECLVFAHRIAFHVTQRPRKLLLDVYPQPPQLQPLQPQLLTKIGLTLPKLMTKYLGLVRDENGLRKVQHTLQTWLTELGNELTFIPYSTREGLEAWNLLTLGLLTVHCALERTESRGAHFRRDFPQPDPRWLLHSGISREGYQKITLQRNAIPESANLSHDEEVRAT